MHGDATAEQSKDPQLRVAMEFLQNGSLPSDEVAAKKLVIQASLLTMVAGILFYLDPRRKNCKRTVVPHHLQEKIINESHRGVYSGHFAL